MKAKTIAYICNHKDGRVKLFMEAPASPMWESSDLVLRHEAQAEIDALKAENEVLHAECDRLTNLLQWEQGRRERIGTHGDECWKWGPAHYECASREIERLTTMLGPQKPMSAEEITEEGPYFHRVPDGKWELVKVTAWKGALSTEWGMYLFGDEEDEELYGDFIGPIKMPEVHG